MSTQPDTGDDELWSTLRGLTNRMDPVPRSVVTAARQTYAWRDPDAALAELLAESADSVALAGVRGGNGPQLFTFGLGELIIDVEADIAARDIGLVGQLVPPQRARIVVHHAGGATETDADDVGRFRANGIARGPVRLTCELSQPTTYRTVQTAWTLI
jgi:hypothetical protein